MRRHGRRAAREADEWTEARLLARTAALVNVNHQGRPNLFECARCRKRFERVDVHHLVSRARGGSHDVENLVCLCRRCHDEIHTGCPADRDHWIRSRHEHRFRNEPPLEGQTGWDVIASDTDGGAA